MIARWKIQIFGGLKTRLKKEKLPNVGPPFFQHIFWVFGVAENESDIIFFWRMFFKGRD